MSKQKFECECGWHGTEDDLRYKFDIRSDEQVCPVCGAFEECKPVEEFKPSVKYYVKPSTTPVSVYRTQQIKYSDGTTGLKVERWNWEMNSWGGHIHDHDKTRKQIEAAFEIIQISENEFLNIT